MLHGLALWSILAYNPDLCPRSRRCAFLSQPYPWCCLQAGRLGVVQMLSPQLTVSVGY